MREVLGRILSKLKKVLRKPIALQSFQAESLTGVVFSTGLVRLLKVADQMNVKFAFNRTKKTQLIPSTFCKGMLTGLVCLTCTKIYAVEFEVVGPCDPKPRLEVYVDVQNEITLGDLTIKVLDSHQLPYKGDRSGIAQIENSPIGRDAVEIISPTQYRAYGWCFHVDGFEPAEMPDQIKVTKSTTKIKWFYASSLYENGEWKDYCIPSYKTPTFKFCNPK